MMFINVLLRVHAQALSLLINLTEMCSSNRTLLEATKLPWVESAAEESLTVLDTVEGLHATLYGNDSALKVLVDLFLQRYSRAESTQIQVLNVVVVRRTCSYNICTHLNITSHNSQGMTLIPSLLRFPLRSVCLS